MKHEELILRLTEGNRRYQASSDAALRADTAINGQRPHTIVIACSDSRVIPEQIFDASLGELFVIRVAGNVLEKHQLGSVEYAAAHLGCSLIVMLGHTHCGAVDAALSGHTDGFISYITDDIREAVGDEKDPLQASRLNVLHGVRQRHPPIEMRIELGIAYGLHGGKAPVISPGPQALHLVQEPLGHHSVHPAVYGVIEPFTGHGEAHPDRRIAVMVLSGQIFLIEGGKGLAAEDEHLPSPDHPLLVVHVELLAGRAIVLGHPLENRLGLIIVGLFQSVPQRLIGRERIPHILQHRVTV